MKPEEIEKILRFVKEGRLSVENALERLKHLPYENIEFARIDHHRHLRQGMPEVIYSEGKRVDQVVKIAQKILEKKGDIIATRADSNIYEALKAIDKRVEYNEQGRVVTIIHKKKEVSKGTVLIISGGTADLPVAEESRAVLDALGSKAETLYDVGVAGIHRLLDNREVIHKSRVIIVVAGMDGALASVVGGLASQPVIAVPTSSGYGASFGGIAALLTMLNSCAAGVAVMNIDNGFGAACLAHKINTL
ncbi:MAG: 1-(5-phosphoribosyl)-5-amino-4-imidazole-carboxylate carboxylase [Nitrospirae bacterium RIFCSPLOW2_12_42_9]|nr:MAG: 1-(5-phosphoribosyl)-5-amino-4-imidazole-carboxylate carboxylase [Nitrospirae bacterium GWA2_42_11]OGW52945.1 MAG: 1-(5-phosphoribosyl)-5-amino-4-imidazole-carboxylate carboxylase [Nitrospirae bacterium RIFCSPLOWO2_02_42_7]OGW56968.1 MAG: 1-(5-phosphoribosyl)-5-amino-4-imidazole-carboxylate carboxylase [Nitrospirae bacterium RIFCSPLOW2_12_42_9]OGW58117.1 MAG: 1-(5-phosphoribosyl)-5-amino-4-imidazole-carboxylate carboxylase [Nitrospirae bacterium RIFCSPHIGHO2_02_FULL_42_12]HAS16955.1 nic